MSARTISIVSRWDSSRVLWSGEAESIGDAVKKARASGANLRGANLGGANLRGANLGDADLRGANLGGADLRDADLGDANLRDADLRGANLGGADLRGANLGDADLRGANLGGADLRGANLGDANLRDADLRGANLRDADLRGANLGDVREDLVEVLAKAPAEVPGLLATLRAGRIDGSVYSGECACLVGTLAKVRGCRYDGIPGLIPNGSRRAEVWFANIRPGDAPGHHAIAALTAEWIEAWLVEHPQRQAGQRFVRALDGSYLATLGLGSATWVDSRATAHPFGSKREATGAAALCGRSAKAVRVVARAVSP